MKKEKKKIFSQKVSAGNITYQFSVEESIEGINYLVITASAENGAKSGKDNRIMIPWKHLESFDEAYERVINFLIEKGESRVHRIMRIRSKYKKAYTKWTDEEDIRLRKGYLKSKTIDQMAEMLYRKPSDIRARLRKLGLLYYG